MQTTISNLAFNDLLVGMRVKIISEEVDSYFWYGEKGTAVSNSGKHLGIRVRLDEPRFTRDGHHKLRCFGFNPEHLGVLVEEKVLLESAAVRGEMDEH